MSIFDYIINVIEPLLLSGFMAFCFDIPRKKTYIFACTLLLFIILTFHNLIGKYESTVFIILLVVLILGVWHNQKKRTIESAVICFIAGLLLAIANYISLFFSAVLFETTIHNVISTPSTYIFLVCLSKIILTLGLFGMYFYRSKFKGTLFSPYWWTLVVLSATVLISATIVLQPFIYNQEITITMLIILAVAIVIIAILFLFTFYRIQKENQEKMQYALAAQKHHFLSDNYSKIQAVSDQMMEAEHRLMYVLLQVRGCLDNQDNENVKVIVDQYIKKIKQFDTVISTGNPYFDFILSKKINEMLLVNTHCKVDLQMQKNGLYDTKEFCDMVLYVITFGNQYIISNTGSLSICGDNQFVIVKYHGQIETRQRIQLSDTIIKLIEKYKGVYDISQLEGIMTIKIVLEL